MNKATKILVGIGLIGLTQMGFSQSINVSQKMPATAAPGSEFTVEVNIEKGSTSGFAKLQEELPDGFTATAIDSKSATFSFDKQRVKLIWMSLPADAKFTISYKVKVDNFAAGPKSISGSFSYIEGNDTKKITVLPTAIEISSSASGAVTTPAETKATAETPKVEEKTPAKEPEKVVEKVAEKEPEKAPVKEVEKVTAPVVENTPAKEMEKPVPPPIEKPAPVAKPAPKPVEAPVAPKAANGIVFRVQVGAGQNAGSEGYLKQKYSIAEEIYSEQIDGVYKYTVGNYSKFSDAKDYRDKVRSSGAEGAFIVSYNNGARIPLQEALKLAGQ